MGVMMTPHMGNRLPPDRVCAFDTGCFNQPTRHDDAAYLAWLIGHRAQERCLFATAPDVVGDAGATLTRSKHMLRVIRALGYRSALVAQDGLESLAVPWDAFDCLFLGGSTGWKLSASAANLAHEASARGKWVHMGRVNSLRRLRIARRMGCDSVDGTYLAFSPDLLGPRMERWVRGVREQMVMDLAGVA
jgi:hypothetical protein